MTNFIKVIALIAIAAGGFIIAGVDFNSNTPVNLDDHCLLTTAECENEWLSVTLEHDVTKPLLPSIINVTWNGQTDEQLTLVIQGLEMDMGQAKYSLSKVAENQYQGTVLLPVCTENKMTWYGAISNSQNEDGMKVKIRMER